MDDNFLARFGDIFRSEPVRMAPSPSIVRAAEDEDIYVDNGEADSAPGVPVPSPTPGPGAIMGNQPVQAPVPPELASPGTIVPPLLNETLKEEVPELALIPEVPEGVPGSEMDEAKAHYERVNGEIAKMEERGISPERIALVKQHNDALGARIEAGEFSETVGKDEKEAGRLRDTQNTPHRKQIMDGLLRRKKILNDEGRHEEAQNVQNQIDAMSKEPNKAGPVTLEYWNLPGSENEVPQDADGAKDLEKSIEDLPEEGSPDVETPDGSKNVVTKSDVKRVAAEDPKGFSKAMNWFQKTFGITGQDLARFALLYAGSRIAGYGHGESMSWGFEVAAKDMLSRRDVMTSLTNSGKYTPKSMEEYRKTGDVSKLKPVTDPKGGIKYDYTNVKYKKGTDEIVHTAVLPDGTKTHVDKSGKPYTGPVEDIGKTEGATEEENEGRDKRIDRNIKIIDDNTKPGKDRKGKTAEDWFIGSSTADAEIVQDRIDYFAKEHGVSLDKGVTARVVNNAAKQARRWAASTGNKVDSLASFIDAQLIYMSDQNKWAQHLSKNGEQLNPDDIVKLNDSIMDFAMNDPSFDPSKVEKGAMLNTFMEYAFTAYSALPQDQKAQYVKRDGFYTFLITEFGTNKEK